MIRLSERLQVIADRLAECRTMADIGTDHGFLPAYMVESGRCEKAIAADISSPSLDKARELCRRLNIQNCELRAGDGLQVLVPGEVSGIAIAGMGGTLMTEILTSGIAVACAADRLVLQPRTASAELRKWLLDHGFAIVAEDVVYEGHFVPEIITVVPPGKWHEGQPILSSERPEHDWEICYEVPPWLVHAGGPVREHISRILKREKTVLQGLQQARNRDEQNLQLKENEIAYLIEMMKKTEKRGTE